jgi:hypothetical protein
VAAEDEFDYHMSTLRFEAAFSTIMAKHPDTLDQNELKAALYSPLQLRYDMEYHGSDLEVVDGDLYHGDEKVREGCSYDGANLESLTRLARYERQKLECSELEEDGEVQTAFEVIDNAFDECGTENVQYEKPKQSH